MGVTCVICRVSAKEFKTAKADRLAERTRYGAKGAVDLDKSWDGILWLISEERREREFMLVDASLPETQALMPTERLDGTDVAYATPKAVLAITTALDAFDEETLREHFKPKAMKSADVYPNIWDQPESFDYLASSFEQLRDMYRKAAEAGDYVLVKIA